MLILIAGIVGMILIGRELKTLTGSEKEDYIIMWRYYLKLRLMKNMDILLNSNLRSSSNGFVSYSNILVASGYRITQDSDEVAVTYFGTVFWALHDGGQAKQGNLSPRAF